MNTDLISQIANMMTGSLKPAGSGPSKAFDRTLHPPKGVLGDSLQVGDPDQDQTWSWFDVEHAFYWHRTYVFMADAKVPEKGLAAITLTDHFVEPKGFEGIFDITNQLAFGIVVGDNPEHLSRRALGQEFGEPAEIVQQIKSGTGATNTMVEAVRNLNFLAQIDYTCRLRSKTQTAGYVYSRYSKDFSFLSLLGYKKTARRGGDLWVRDLAET